MSVQILHDSTLKIACFYCPEIECVFGPSFKGGFEVIEGNEIIICTPLLEAEYFLSSFSEVPDEYQLQEIELKYSQWRALLKYNIQVLKLKKSNEEKERAKKEEKEKESQNQNQD